MLPFQSQLAFFIVCDATISEAADGGCLLGGYVCFHSHFFCSVECFPTLELLFLARFLIHRVFKPSRSKLTSGLANPSVCIAGLGGCLCLCTLLACVHDRCTEPPHEVPLAGNLCSCRAQRRCAGKRESFAIQMHTRMDRVHRDTACTYHTLC